MPFRSQYKAESTARVIHRPGVCRDTNGSFRLPRRNICARPSRPGLALHRQHGCHRCAVVRVIESRDLAKRAECAAGRFCRRLKFEINDFDNAPVPETSEQQRAILKEDGGLF